MSSDLKIKNSALLTSILSYSHESGCVVIASKDLSNESIIFSDHKNTITVARHNSSAENIIHKAKNIDISAPDKKITSLMAKNLFSRTTYITSDDSYASTAVVSATASLMLSINAGLYVDEIKNILINTSIKNNEQLPLLNCKKAIEESVVTRDQLINDLFSPTLDVQKTSLEKITIRGDSLVPLLIDQYRQQKDSVGKKGILIHSLGEIKSNASLPYLINMLQHEDNNYIKRNIIEAIGKIGDPSALDILINALNDSNSGIRYKAAIALGKLGMKNAGPTLMDKLNDPDERVVTESIESLTKIKYKKAVSRFNEDINSTYSDQFAKDQMVFAIGELGDKSSLSALFLYKKTLLTGEPANNIVKYKWKESIKIVNEAIKKIESRDE